MTTYKPQILLRIDDENGHHIIKKHENTYSIEGHFERPENRHVTPQYFFPIEQDYVAAEFAKQGKEWRY